MRPAKGNLYNLLSSSTGCCNYTCTMHRSLLKALGALPFVVITIAVCIPLFFLNLWFVSHYLLRLQNPADPISELPLHMPPIKCPLFATGGANGLNAPIREHFLSTLGLGSGGLPTTHHLLVDIGYITRVSPYPQPNSALLDQPVHHLTAGYIGTDNQYHQVTYYWGEADSTPSPLVEKVRGNETGWGDYFVRYSVYLTRSLQPDLQNPPCLDHPPNAPNPRVRIDRIDWSAYTGGSSDGSEELGVAMTMLPIELLLLALLCAHAIGSRPLNGRKGG